MSGYIRQSQADIVPGVVVQAAPLNKEFNALSSAFSGSTGHSHDGTLGNGPRLSLSTSVQGILSVQNGGTGSSDLSTIQVNLGLEIGKNVQAWDADLDKISNITGLGLLTKTTGSDWALRKVVGKANETTVSPETGASGDIVVSLPNSLTFTGKTITGGTFNTGTFSGTFTGNGAGLTSVPVSGIQGLTSELDKKFDKIGGVITGPVNFADNIAMGMGKVLTQSAIPSLPAHVVNKQYADTLSDDDRKRSNHTGTQEMSTVNGLVSEFTKYLKLVGGTLTGLLNMGSQRITNLGAGVEASDAVRLDQLQSFMPAGMVVPYGGPTAPAGWLLCNGQAVSRTTYSSLYSAIGTRFGSGDGVSSFGVPDLRGRVIAGYDPSQSRLSGKSGGVSSQYIGNSGGQEEHKLLVSQIPSHNHGGKTGWGGVHVHTTNGPASNEGVSGVHPMTRYGTALAGTSEHAGHDHTVSSQGGDQAHNNVQPTLILNYIIKI